MSRKGPTPIPPMVRIWKYIAIKDGCWGWTGYLHKGYGQFTIPPQHVVRAYRYLYIQMVGDPGKLNLDHLCCNTECVRPDHLEPVTHGENVRRGLAGLKNRRKTKCPRGHPYAGSNLRIERNSGRRTCRACDNERQMKSKRVSS